MIENEVKDLGFEQSFDVKKVSFRNVNEEFENNFKKSYKKSLNMMSDDKDRIRSASGANSLGILEKMAQRIEYYDKSSDFEKSYNDLEKEYEPFTET
jgi:hypothetical protein